MINIIIIICAIVIVLFYHKTFSRSVLGISIEKSNYIGIGMFLNIAVYVIPGVVMILVFGVDRFWALFTIQQNEVAYASSLLLLLLGFLFLSFLVFSNTVFKRIIFLGPRPFQSLEIYRLYKLSATISIWLLIVFLAMFILFGYRHAMIQTIVGGGSLSTMRHGNTTLSAPTFIIYFYIINSYFLASISALLPNWKKYFYLVVAVVFASVSGQKMPVLATVLVFFCSYCVYRQVRLSISTIIKSVFYVFLFFILMYFLVKLQYSYYNVDSFLDYLLNRVGVGFVAGFYEQYHLRLQNIDYIWHSVPFYNVFFEGDNFHKDLMILSEGRVNLHDIGIKNTLLFAEAYAIGGPFLLLASPVIYAFNYLFSILIISKFVSTNYLNDFRSSVAFVGMIFVMFVGVTGGFSDILFFKTPILFFLFIAGPIISCRFFFAKPEARKRKRY